MKPAPHASRIRAKARIERCDPPPGAVSPWVQLRTTTFHPFIYKRMLRGADPLAKPGDIVHVYGKEGSLFGGGFFNPRSEIALRMLVHGDEPIDDPFWRRRLETAVELRRQLRLDEVTDAYRVVHGEGDDLTGLVVERYGDILAAEVFALGMQSRAATLLGVLAEVLGPPSRLDRPQLTSDRWRFVIRVDKRAAELEGMSPEPVTDVKTTIREHGIRYHVDLTGGHKTGFFCDQRDNRKRFAELCREGAVLDCCCYTGGFGLCAKLIGSAREVTSVDLDEAALAVARDNANLNQTRIQHVHADAFSYLRQMHELGRAYDAVVLDPPKLAMGRRDVEEALGKYHDLNALGCQVVRPGGILLTCSCSGAIGRDVFLQTVHLASRRAGRRLQQFGESGAAGDHPVAANCPESAYLKALWFRVI